MFRPLQLSIKLDWIRGGQNDISQFWSD